MVIERRRLKRLKVPGSAISFSVTRLDSGTSAPSFARTCNASRSAVETRALRSACSITSYSSPLSTKVVARRPPIMVSSVVPIAVADTPRSAARVLSTTTRICGRVSL